MLNNYLLLKRKFAIRISLSFLAFMLFSGCDGNSPDQNLLDEKAFLSDVYDYKYAPGQYAGTDYSASSDNFKGIPAYLQANSSVTKNPVSLGGWGGYIVAGFNHDVLNRSGNDIIIFCGSSPSPEPGVMFVMEDTNNNGFPDDTWYELKGSDYNNTATIHNYTVTYHKPASEQDNIFWEDNKANNGTLLNGYGTGTTYSWWKYTDESVLVFTGSRLPDAYINTGTQTQNWTLRSGLFEWGYAENANGTDYNPDYKGNEFDISNAVDAAGNAVTLSSIRFIKVQTGVFQQAGWLNENSTEIYGAADISMLNK